MGHAVFGERRYRTPGVDRNAGRAVLPSGLLPVDAAYGMGRERHPGPVGPGDVHPPALVDTNTALDRLVGCGPWIDVIHRMDQVHCSGVRLKICHHPSVLAPASGRHRSSADCAHLSMPTAMSAGRRACRGRPYRPAGAEPARPGHGDRGRRGSAVRRGGRGSSRCWRRRSQPIPARCSG